MFPASVRYVYPNCFIPLDSREEELQADCCVGHWASGSVLKKTNTKPQTKTSSWVLKTIPKVKGRETKRQLRELKLLLCESRGQHSPAAWSAQGSSMSPASVVRCFLCFVVLQVGWIPTSDVCGVPRACCRWTTAWTCLSSLLDSCSFGYCRIRLYKLENEWRAWLEL